MRNVIFVAPYFMEATERFIAAATRVPNVRLGLVSCDPESKLQETTRRGLSAHFAVESIEPKHLLHGIEKVGKEFGGIDRIIGMLEQIQVPLGQIRDHLKVLGMGEVAANNFRDKSQMKDVLHRAGIPCARHRLISSTKEAEAFAGQIGFPLIVKPPDGAGAQGTFRCENMEHLDQCLTQIRPSGEQPILVEEFMTGNEHSFDSICIEGKIVWSSISNYSPGPLEVVREPWIQWCVMIPRETNEQHRHIEEIAQNALAALGMQTGLSHMEWFERPDGSVAISEVGARPPGAQFTTLISYAHDIDLYEAWAELMMFERFQPVERKYAVGAAYLRAAGQGRVAEVSGLKEIAAQLGDIVVEAKLPKVGQPTSGSYEGEGYIIVRHPETSVVENALKTIVNLARVRVS